MQSRSSLNPEIQSFLKELTSRVEQNLAGAIGAKLPNVELSASGARKLTTEQREEIVEHGLNAVSQIQIRELDNMIHLLADNVFDDPKDRYYVSIDMLDEDWADDRIKFKLVRALIDVVRRFKAIPNVKIIFALRQDLLDKVIHSDPIPGFQEEKYRSLYLTIQWNKKDLGQVVERRINQLIRRRYTKGDISFADVFPKSVDGQETLAYMLDRTFLRPRDIIVFVNECLELSEGRANVSAAIIKDAERRYSLERLQSLADEWRTIYPNLSNTVQLFHGLHNHFPVSEITEQFLEDRYNDIATDIVDAQSDQITQSLCNLYTERANFGAIRNFVLRQFYVTGLLGIKTGPSDSTSWSYHLPVSARLSAGDVRASSTLYIHPMFHRALGVLQRDKQQHRK